MSRFPRFDFGQVQRYSVAGRHSKVTTESFGRPVQADSVTDFLDSLPDLLAANSLRQLVSGIREARARRRAIIWGFGGHVVKTGLGPVLVDLAERGFVTALATNGSGLIHDFETAMWGRTSEDVDQELGGGGFGMAEETGKWLNQAIAAGAERGQGVGESVGAYLAECRAPFAECSLTATAQRLGIPLTVHIALGTDIIHMHPEASGAALGQASMTDFGILTAQVADLDGGGVYLNLGSAVVLPEVFLKAVSAVRSSGRSLSGFITANLDFIQHYRPLQNVVRRPVLQSGVGMALTGHHEIMVPLLAACLRWSDRP